MAARHTPDTKVRVRPQIVLKRDAFGTVSWAPDAGHVIRETADAAPFLRALARTLARREAQTLQRLAGTLVCPRLIEAGRSRVVRSYLPGEPLYAARFDARSYFRDALRQLRRMHSRRTAHNDLAKEANWICLPGNRAGIVDFQVACNFARRSPLFRTLAREDLRHLLKHKQHYAPELLTQRQRAILAHPLWTTRIWRVCVKPVYRFITRRLLGWQDRSSAIERAF